MTPAEVVWPVLLLLLLFTLQLARTLIQLPHSSTPTNQVGHSIAWPAWARIRGGRSRYRPRHRRR